MGHLAFKIINIPKKYLIPTRFNTLNFEFLVFVPLKRNSVYKFLKVKHSACFKVATILLLEIACLMMSFEAEVHRIDVVPREIYL